MNRKDFIRNGLLGTGVFVSSAAFGKVFDNDIDELTPLEVIGFNHLPNPNTTVMANSVFHTSDTRGDANHGWLHSRHTFSFANYYNPERMHFGVLRVLNDDVVAGGRGFGTHPHDNMEIISIPLEGDLEHRDNMGNAAVIRSGDVQVMSAGTGITHSEFNKNTDQAVKFLQIWVFPNKRDVTPRYDQITLAAKDRKNKLQQILSPSPDDDGVWIHQDAWFHLADLDAGTSVPYTIKRKGNGVYIFNLRGKLIVNDQLLEERDGFGLWNLDNLSLRAESATEFLLIDVPMSL